MAASNEKSNVEEFDYLPPPRSEFIPFANTQESMMDKMKRKTKENPFVPFGLAFTTFALSYGLWQMKTGNTGRSQMMMRLRIVGQSFTIFAVLGGIMYTANKKLDN